MKQSLGSTSGLPPDLHSIVEDLHNSEEQAAKLCAGLTHPQANWQPNEGTSWSIVQCLGHLSLTNRIYAEAIREAVSRADVKRMPRSSAISPPWFGRWFVRSLEPPVRTKMKAPTKIRPAEEGNIAETLAEFLRSHESVRAVIETGSGLDFNRLRFRNPFIPLVRWTAGTGLLIINAHDRRHLWQASRVKESPGFPQN